MVRALLAGTKSQTRRIVSIANSLVNGSPPCRSKDSDIIEAWCNLDFSDARVDPGPSPAGNAGPYLKIAGGDESYHRVYPRASIGDHLWVRETWRRQGSTETISAVRYRADESSDEATHHRWRPSIFLPRWASRITLEITSVRVERLQDISGEDAITEGIDIPRCGCEVCRRSLQMCPADQSAAIMAYAELWSSINHKRAPWDSNPWVWIYEVRTMSP
jgi:hypothetical protein